LGDIVTARAGYGIVAGVFASGETAMERDALYFGMIALGGLLVWALFRRGRSTGGKVALVACMIAVGIAYALLFRMMGAGAP
jgi:hypothetical protein